MKIFLLQIKEDAYGGYDSFDSHVVIADTEDRARLMCPSGDEGKMAWQNPEASTCSIIGECSEEKMYVVISSFNAG